MKTETITLGFSQDTRERIRVPLAEVLRHSVVLGKSGSGKSFLTTGIVCQLLASAHRPCITVVDLKGETCDLIRNLALLVDASPRLAPPDILSFSLAHGVCLPLDPLVRIPGVGRDVQAAIVVDLLAELSQGFGPRMVNVARCLVNAVMDAGGSLLDVRAVLVDERLASVLAGRVIDAELKHYLTDVFPHEPAASKDSLRSRLDTLLALPTVRAMLCCGRSTPVSAFLDSRLALIDLGGAGMGGRAIATFIGSWMFTLISAAIYARNGAKDPRHAYVVIDEWQRLAGFATEELEDILATARSNRVSLTLCNQYAEQISSISSSLFAGVIANVALEFLFRPNEADLRHLDRQLPVTGRRVDPARPDRLLTAAAEREQVRQELGNLRPREALFVNHLSGEPARVLSSPTLPAAEAQGAWIALSEAEKSAWLFGKYGTTADALTCRRVLPLPAGSRPAVVPREEFDESPDTDVVPRSRTSRMRLRVLP